MPRKQRLCANIFELQALEIRRLLTTATINNTTHTLVVTGTSSADTITLNQSASTGKVSVTGVTTTFTPGTGTNQFTKISVDAGGGNDTIQINGNVAYTAATLGGGGGNDTMIGGSKADQLAGGSGFDTANYSLRTAGITVTIDNAANDGQSGEGDNVTTDTEEVLGGSGNDKFTGSGNDDFFAGGAGNDTAFGGNGNDDLTGSTGQDDLEGQNGDDFLQAKNNDVDTVKGGTNTDGTSDLDLAEVDGIDVGTLGPVQQQLASQTTTIDRTQLDTTYNGTGTNIGPDLGWQSVSAATMDSQGREIIVGTANRFNQFENSSQDMVAVRYNADGSFDTGFGYNGEAAIDFTIVGNGYSSSDVAYGVTTDANDNIYIVGSSSIFNGFGFQNSDFAVAKLNSGGQRDSLFGNNGTAVEDVNINPSVGGGYNDEAHDAVVDANGNVIVVGVQNNNNGADGAIMRFDNSGQLDDNFNNSGQNYLDVNPGSGSFDVFNAVQLQPNGSNPAKIVVAGSSSGSFLVARYNDDGTIDNSFGNGYGYSADNFIQGTDQSANALALDANNIYLVGESDVIVFGGVNNFNPGSNASATIARYSADGVFDTGVTFPNGEGFPEQGATLTSVVIDPASGHLIVAGGNQSNYIWGDVDQTTLNLDPNFNNGQFIETDFTPPDGGEYYDLAQDVAITSDGKVQLGGFSDTNGDGAYLTSVARYGLEVSSGPHDTTDGITDFVDDSELHSNPPPFPLNLRLQNLSTSAKLYVLAQPDSNGVATFDLTNANDTVTIYNGVDGNGNPQVFVNVNNVVIPYDPGSTTLFRFNLMGGNDSLTTGPGVNIPMIVHAGDGNDFVQTGDGNDLIDGGKGIDLLSGGKGNDVILGGADTDALSGDDGNDLLIGGTGIDGLFGGAGEDILIGGTTSYDNNETALLAIISEWGSTNSNPDRIAHIRGTLPGGANGTFFLKAGAGATVFNDTYVDALTGGTGRDWFFRKNSNPNRDQIIDNLTGEEVTNM